TTPGLLDSINYKIGDVVNVGDHVATLENNDLDYQIQLATTSKTIASTNLEKGTSPLRTEELIILQNKLSAAKSNEIILKNSLASTRLSKKELENQVSINLDILSELETSHESNKLLYADGAISKQALDKSLLNFTNQEKKYDSAKLATHKLDEELTSINSRIDIVKLEADSISQNIQMATSGLSDYDKTIAITSLENADISEQRLLSLADSRNIRSKQSGIIENINYDLGDYITPGMPIMTLYNDKEIKVKIYVHESNLPNIKIGDTLNVSLASNSELNIDGQVTYIARDAMFTPFNIVTVEDRERLVYEVELSLKKPDYLHPGMLLQVEIKDGERDE
ncbi:MAG: HlyD family efflux transporter periplasmic adaptor subunit, partial [Acidaminobacteraceae bacterium]